MEKVIFGKLRVIFECEERKERRIQYLCTCECGNLKIVAGKQLRKGTSSCGCIQKEVIGSLNRKSLEFKFTEHPLYNRWCGMLQRCYNKNHHKYPYYGARGISVCDSWENSFENFINDMGDCPPDHTLDRIDNSGNYCKDNCRWASYKEQANNRRKKNSVK